MHKIPHSITSVTLSNRTPSLFSVVAMESSSGFENRVKKQPCVVVVKVVVVEVAVVADTVVEDVVIVVFDIVVLLTVVEVTVGVVELTVVDDIVKVLDDPTAVVFGADTVRQPGRRT